jgi:hypothetical protein
MALSDEEWRLAKALAVRRQHGDRAAAVVMERIKTLSRAGDDAGVDRWQQIANQIDQLERATIQ